MKRYTVDVNDFPCEDKKEKKNEYQKPASISWEIVFFAIFVAYIISPDLVDMKTYIPQYPQQYENPNSF